MIQRIQSVFLALAMLLVCLLFYFVLCDFHFPNGEIAEMKMNGFIGPYQYLNNQVVSSSRFPLLLVLSAGLFILLAVTLFSYRNRPRQLRLCTIAFFINIILLGFLFLGPDMLSTKLSMALDLGLDKQAARKMVHYQWATFFPFASLLCINFAARRIKKDEALVRSAERLR
ncbi:MAG: DUF4293 domain-containing protein [Lentimicrobiaceae bacterium]|nr:DUF4293 domain-containing protein [Lentimicrobiaceae bacterium]